MADTASFFDPRSPETTMCSMTCQCPTCRSGGSGEFETFEFDMAAGLAKGKALSEAALNAARSRLPGGPLAKAAFDSGLALAKGRSLQDSLIAGGGRLLPKSPYAADALSFVRKAAAGENLGKAALSSAGNLVMKRIEQQTGPIISRARGRLPIAVPQARQRQRGTRSVAREIPDAARQHRPQPGGVRQSGRWVRRGRRIVVGGA